MNDWIEWPGGDCPVAKGTLVDVKYRDGTEARGVTAGTWYGEPEHISDNGFNASDWNDDDNMTDIVAYRLAQPAHVTRLLAERDELKARADKLELLFHTNTYRSIDQLLLKDQYAAMTEYLAVLDKRIARL
jgi:hypothetical protein